MAIDKPAGMIVHGDGTGERTLTDYASDLLLAMGDGFAATERGGGGRSAGLRLCLHCISY